MNRLHKDDPNQLHCKREWPTKRGHQEQNIGVPEAEAVDACMLVIMDYKLYESFIVFYFKDMSHFTKLAVTNQHVNFEMFTNKH